MTDKPRAWMRRWAFDRNDGTKGNRPKGWTLQPVTTHRLFADDVPLFTRDSDGNGGAGETEGLDPKGDSAGGDAASPIGASHDH